MVKNRSVLAGEERLSRTIAPQSSKLDSVVFHKKLMILFYLLYVKNRFVLS
jgi:hypothetical protein